MIADVKHSPRQGKQNYKCRDCGRQFVENPLIYEVSETKVRILACRYPY